MYFEQSDLERTKYWNDLFQVLTEDENLRIRKGDMMNLAKTDVVEFMGSLSLFEKRMEDKIASLNKTSKHGKG